MFKLTAQYWAMHHVIPRACGQAGHHDNNVGKETLAGRQANHGLKITIHQRLSPDGRRFGLSQCSCCKNGFSGCGTHDYAALGSEATLRSLDPWARTNRPYGCCNVDFCACRQRSMPVEWLILSRRIRQNWPCVPQASPHMPCLGTSHASSGPPPHCFNEICHNPQPHCYQSKFAQGQILGMQTGKQLWDHLIDGALSYEHSRASRALRGTCVVGTITESSREEYLVACCKRACSRHLWRYPTPCHSN